MPHNFLEVNEVTKNAFNSLGPILTLQAHGLKRTAQCIQGVHFCLFKGLVHFQIKKF